MARIFKVAVTEKMGDFNVVGDKSKVDEDLFWQLLGNQIQVLTSGSPEKYEETFDKAKEHLLRNTNYKTRKESLTVEHTYFEVAGIPD